MINDSPSVRRRGIKWSLSLILMGAHDINQPNSLAVGEKLRNNRIQNTKKCERESYFQPHWAKQKSSADKWSEVQIACTWRNRLLSEMAHPYG
jgi:hypothetical protein